MTEQIQTAPKQNTPLKGPAEDQVASVITGMIALKKWQFYAQDDEISADKVAGPMHMLPALLWQVEKMYRVAYGGASTGVKYEPSETLMGATAVLPPGRPRSPLILFAQEALQRAIENYPTLDGASIDHMVQEFMDDRDAGIIPWVSPQVVPGVSVQAGGMNSAM